MRQANTIRNPRRIVIMGPEGSGKGTQAVRLARRLRLPTVSTGDLLRAEMKRTTVLGQRIARLMNRGTYLPTSIVNRLLLAWLRVKGKRGFILDGYPRRLDQVRTLDRVTRIDLALVMDLSDSNAVRRLSGRRVSGCGKTYHVISQPPPRNGRCGQCGDRLRQREDDQPTQVRGRLYAYHVQTDPVIRLYDRRQLSLHIDARPDIATVARTIARKIRERAVAKL